MTNVGKLSCFQVEMMVEDSIKLEQKELSKRSRSSKKCVAVNMVVDSTTHSKLSTGHVDSTTCRQHTTEERDHTFSTGIITCRQGSVDSQLWPVDNPRLELDFSFLFRHVHVSFSGEVRIGISSYSIKIRF